MEFKATLSIVLLFFFCNQNTEAQDTATISDVLPLSANGLAAGVVGGAVGGTVGISLPISACPGDQLMITIDTVGNFGPSNVFTAQLVDDPLAALGGLTGGLPGLPGLGGGFPGIPGFPSFLPEPTVIDIGQTEPGGSPLDLIGGLLGGLVDGVTGALTGGLTGALTGGLTGGGLGGGIPPAGGLPTIGGTQTLLGTIPDDIASGIYSLRVTSTDPVDTSEYYASSISIQRAEKPTITMSCLGDSTLLTSSNASSYSWSTGSDTSFTMVPNMDETYTLTITNASGCEASSDTSIIANPIIMECKEQFLTLSSTLTAGSYSWSTSETTNFIEMADVEASGSIISLSTLSPFTCAAINSPQCPDPNEGMGGTSVVPNVFSPNHDYKNDLFLIKDHGNNIKSISIYDSWGNTVFETERIADAWDGNNRQGVECLNGIYFYVLEMVSGSQANISTKGYVQLVR